MTELGLKYLGCFLYLLYKDIHITYINEERSPGQKFLLKGATVLVNRDKHRRNCSSCNIIKLLCFLKQYLWPQVRIWLCGNESNFQGWSQAVMCKEHRVLRSQNDAYTWLCSLLEEPIFLGFHPYFVRYPLLSPL